MNAAEFAADYSTDERSSSGRRLGALGAAARPRDLATELRSAPRLEARPGPAADPRAKRRPIAVSSHTLRLPRAALASGFAAELGRVLPSTPGPRIRAMRVVRWPIAALLCALAFVVGAPVALADPADPDLAQSVAAHEEWSAEPAEIGVGHLDLGPRLIDGQWRAGLRHDDAGRGVWHDPNQTVLRVSDSAIMTAPDSADYPFLADVAGKPVHVIPQTQNPNVVWLGWNTQDPAVTATIDRGLTMRVGPVSGPGRAWLFLQSGTFGKPLLLADSGAQPGDVWIDSGTHVHANWAFSAPGTYTVTVTFSGTTTSGEAVSASTTLRFAVGDSASASEAFAMAPPTDKAAASPSQGDASGKPSASRPAGEAAAGDPASEGGLPDWAFLALIGAVIVSVAIIAALVVARARTSRAEQAAAIAEADSAPPATDPGAASTADKSSGAGKSNATTAGDGSEEGSASEGLVDGGGER